MRRERDEATIDAGGSGEAQRDASTAAAAARELRGRGCSLRGAGAARLRGWSSHTCELRCELLRHKTLARPVVLIEGCGVASALLGDNCENLRRNELHKIVRCNTGLGELTSSGMSTKFCSSLLWIRTGRFKQSFMYALSIL